jgi:hypothetical protein
MRYLCLMGCLLNQICDNFGLRDVDRVTCTLYFHGIALSSCRVPALKIWIRPCAISRILRRRLASRRSCLHGSVTSP